MREETDEVVAMESPITEEDGKLIRWLKRKTIRGFEGHSIYDVGKYFLNSMFNENINLRASSLSFNFFFIPFPFPDFYPYPYCRFAGKRSENKAHQGTQAFITGKHMERNFFHHH